jgi:hypothetical protein
LRIAKGERSADKWAAFRIQAAAAVVNEVEDEAL